VVEWLFTNLFIICRLRTREHTVDCMQLHTLEKAFATNATNSSEIDNTVAENIAFYREIEET